MKFSLFSLISATGLLLSSHTSATVLTLDDISNFYTGVIYADQDVDSANADFESMGIVLGVQIDDTWSVETRYIGGDTGFRISSSDAQIDYSEQLDYQASIQLKGNYNIYQGLSVYGLAGYTRSDLNVAGSLVSNRRASGFSYGAGVEYNLTEHLNLFADYQVLPSFGLANSDRDWRVASLGFSYHF